MWGRGYNESPDSHEPHHADLGVKFRQISLGWRHGLALTGITKPTIMHMMKLQCSMVCFAHLRTRNSLSLYRKQRGIRVGKQSLWTIGKLTRQGHQQSKWSCHRRADFSWCGVGDSGHARHGRCVDLSRLRTFCCRAR